MFEFWLVYSGERFRASWASCFDGGGAEGAGVDGWTDKEAQTNLPLQLLRSLGHNSSCTGYLSYVPDKLNL